MGLIDIARKERFIEELNEKRGISKDLDNGIIINRVTVKEIDPIKREVEKIGKRKDS